MKRIFTNHSFIRLSLTLALLAAQFGCATTQEKETYNLYPEDILKVNTLDQSVIDQSTFSRKIEELRSKAKGNHIQDTTVFGILEKIDSLEEKQLSKHDKWRKASTKGAMVGSLLFGSLWVGWILSTLKEDHEGWWKLGLLATWEPMLAGGLLGGLAGKNFRGREVSRKNTDELNRQISNYNNVENSSIKTASIVLRRDRKCNLAELGDKVFEIKVKVDEFCRNDEACLALAEKADSIYRDQMQANKNYEKSKGWILGLIKGGFWGALVGFGVSAAVGSNKFQSDWLPIYVLTPLGGALGMIAGENASGSRSNARIAEKAQTEIAGIVDKYNENVKKATPDRQ